MICVSFDQIIGLSHSRIKKKTRLANKRAVRLPVFQFSISIWCTSKARVNLPHIGNEECFQFVLQQNLINEA
jgi:hypothetical protein